jgi:glycosyltransferase involved in cell wall biosynthesis
VDRGRFYRHGRRSIREAVFFAAGMLRIFRYKFDVIQSNQFPILQLPVLKLYCMVTGCRLIVNVHEVWDREYWTTYLGPGKGKLANAYANWALRMADYYISNSSVTEQNLRGLGIGKDRITVFAPTIDHRKLAAIRESRHKREIIFAGRLIKEKRLDKWLGVLSRTIRITRARGVIIGDGPERERIEALVKEMGLGRHVEVRSFYSGANKPALFRRIKDAGLFLHMSEREGLSTVALESIALGTPVLLPSYTPIPTDVKDMCVVVPEAMLPRMAAKILSGPKSDYLRNSKGMERFYTSSTPAVYGEIFKRMGL